MAIPSTTDVAALIPSPWALLFDRLSLTPANAREEMANRLEIKRRGDVLDIMFPYGPASTHNNINNREFTPIHSGYFYPLVMICGVTSTAGTSRRCNCST